MRRIISASLTAIVSAVAAALITLLSPASVIDTIAMMAALITLAAPLRQ